VTLVLPPEPPTQGEVDAITSAMLSASLMATDSIIGQAGRSGVVLILNGSRSKNVLELGWDKLSDYGALKHLTADQIARKVDWCIHNKWLRMEYNRDGIPLLHHSEKGWEQVKPL
jgi:superfamily II DNA helicase RecQ